MLKLIATTQYDAAYCIEFRNSNLNDDMLKLLFDHIKYLSILHNIMVIEDNPMRYQSETIDYCEHIVANNGPVCVVIYDGYRKYDLRSTASEWYNKNGDYTKKFRFKKGRLCSDN